MRILHYIPDMPPSNSDYSYQRAMTAAMEQREEVTVVSRLTRIEKTLNDAQPDIVHIHACWSATAYQLHRKCIARRIPVVLTPGRHIEPHHIADRYLRSKLPKLLAYQRFMLRNAQVLHALTDQQHQRLLTITLLPSNKQTDSSNAWNPRVATIPDCTITHGTTADTMAADMLRLYAKVIDSHPFMFLNSHTLQVEDALLTEGLMRRHTMPADMDYTMPTDVAKTMTAMDSKTWRLLFLHADEQGIADYVAEGAHSHGINTEMLINIPGVDRFPHTPRTYTCTAAERRAIKRVTDDTALSQTDKNVALIILNTIYKTRQTAAARCDYANLFLALRLTDCNEDALRHTLTALRQDKAAARLFQLLADNYALTEGYMLFEPLNDKHTDIIRQQLFAANIR